jgi:hypothetical protein
MYLSSFGERTSSLGIHFSWSSKLLDGLASLVSLQSLWKTTRSLYYRSFEQSLVSDLTWICVVGEEMIRVERDSALCGRLNKEVGHLYGVTEPWDKSCVSCVHDYCVCSSFSYSHYFVEDFPIYLWCGFCEVSLSDLLPTTLRNIEDITYIKFIW